MLSAVVLFAGCASDGTQSIQNDTVTGRASVTQTADTTSVTTAETVAEPEPEPEPKNIPTPMKLKPLEKSGMYRVKDIKKGIFYISDYTDNGNTVLIEKYKTYDSAPEFEAFDLCNRQNAGTLSIENAAEDWGALSYGFWFFSKGKLILTDPALNVTAEYGLPYEKCRMMWVSPDGRMVLFNRSHGATEMFTLSNGLIEQTEMSQDIRVKTVTGYDGTAVTATNSKDEHYRIMLTGAVTELSDGECEVDYFAEYPDSRIVRYSDMYDAEVILDKDTGATKTVLFNDWDEYVVAANWKYMVTFISDKKFRVYDLQNCVATDFIKTGQELSRAVISENGGIFLADGSYNDEDDYLSRAFFVDTAELDFTEDFRMINREGDAPFSEAFFLEPETEDEEVRELLDELHEDYLVDVFFEAADIDDNLPSYVCRPFTGDALGALESLKDFLDLSPRELVSEASDGKGLWVMFTDKIEDSDRPPYSLAGFSSKFAGHSIIVIQVDSGSDYEGDIPFTKMMENFSHEFIHFLDDKYDWDTDLNDEWEELSPEGSYFYSYSYPEDADTMQYTMYYTYGGDDHDAYFINEYSRTYPTEDRAQNAEQLYRGYLYDYKPFADYPHLEEKCKKMIEIYRELFPCLEEIPEGEWYLEKSVG